MTEQSEALVVEIASILDHPSLYMGGPSRQSMKKARAILPIIEAREASAKADAEACAPYLKDGETPAECIKWNRDDSIALMELLAAERVKVSNYEKTMQVISESGLEEAKALVAAKEQAERLLVSALHTISNATNDHIAREVARAALAAWEKSRG